MKLDDELKKSFSDVMRLNISIVYRAFEQIGLYPGQSELLNIINKENGISQMGIAKKTKTSKVTIAKMVRRMEELKLLKRESSKKDKRVKLVYITKKGKKNMEIANSVIDEIFLKSIRGITKDEKEELNKMYSKILSNLIEIDKSLKIGDKIYD